ncbi:hypothetical protein RIF29_39393 [Crotalaria pallida]|uniref:Uncharacterized protein n=1 Tax=Crotalaria pallida TaxID=3830 RepID=A0AAN9E1M4_CROPI
MNKRKSVCAVLPKGKPNFLLLRWSLLPPPVPVRAVAHLAAAAVAVEPNLSLPASLSRALPLSVTLCPSRRPRRLSTRKGCYFFAEATPSV